LLVRIHYWLWLRLLNIWLTWALLYMFYYFSCKFACNHKCNQLCCDQTKRSYRTASGRIGGTAAMLDRMNEVEKELISRNSRKILALFPYRKGWVEIKLKNQLLPRTPTA
jgi:hypothetical protein